MRRKRLAAACGSSVRIVKALALSFLLAVPSAAHADPAADLQLREVEASLLHRRIDLSGVKQWERDTDDWHPLSVVPRKLYVINLWSVHCVPCKEEFPLLRKMVEGWRSQKDVKFLFIADPPHDTEEQELTTYWRSAAAQLPDEDPCRSTDERIRNMLESGLQPITLLVDEHMVIRQAFAGAIGKRNLAIAIQRLLNALKSEEKPVVRKVGQRGK